MAEAPKTYTIKEIIFSLTMKLHRLSPWTLDTMIEDLERCGEGDEPYLINAVKVAKALQRRPNVTPEEYRKLVEAVVKEGGE